MTIKADGEHEVEARKKNSLLNNIKNNPDTTGTVAGILTFLTLTGLGMAACKFLYDFMATIEPYTGSPYNSEETALAFSLIAGAFILTVIGMSSVGCGILVGESLKEKPVVSNPSITSTSSAVIL